MAMIPCVETQANWVRYEHVGDVTTDRHTGVIVQEFVDQHMVRPLLIRILEAPDKLYYGGHEAQKWTYTFKKVKSNTVSAMANAYIRKSCEFDVPVEVKPGDICIMRHLGNLNDAIHGYIEYDKLVARLDPGGRLYPLNGRLLLRMDEDTSGIVNFKNRQRHHLRMTSGVVVAQGCKVSGYLMWPRFEDADFDWIGKRLFFRQFAAVRIENDVHGMLDYDTPFPYYRIDKPLILGYND